MEVSSRGVQDHRFSTSMRGYDKAEVQAFLATVAKHISSQEEHLAIATAKAERAKEELDRLNDVIESRLAEAQSARDAIIEEAKAEASQITEASGTGEGGQTNAEAARTAAAIISEAETKANLRLSEVDAVTQKARTDAEAIAKEADYNAELKVAEADRVLDNARREAREMHKDTEKSRTELEMNLQELKQVVQAARSSDGDLSDVNIVLKNGDQIVVDLRAPVKAETEQSELVD